MVSRKQFAVDDSSSDEDINMDKMIETKDELNKIRREREAARAKLKSDFDKTLTNLHQRITEAVEAHAQERDAVRKAKVDRLQQAVAARGRIEQLIKEKLRELQVEFQRISAVLESCYEYRLDKASKSLANVSLNSTESKQDVAHEQARHVVKVKLGSSSS
ncbi:unnamed protein product [Discula destructiva]